MRVFTSSGLIITRLQWDEWVILALYAVFVLWPQALVLLLGSKTKLEPSAQEAGGVLVIGFGAGLAMVAFSPGTRFRNVFFSGAWLLLSSWLAVKSRGLAIEPLMLFAFYHALRWHFWRRYGREWVPASVDRDGYNRARYRLEKRHSSFEDIRYTKFLFRVGMVLLFLFLILPMRLFVDSPCSLPCLYQVTSKP